MLPLLPAIMVLATAARGHAEPSTPGHGAAFDSLVAAERAFSRLSVEQGMREAFLAYLAEDGILFQPLPVNGRQVWQDRPPSKATLIWEPAFAEIAAAGDLGYTTGPWELRPPAEAKERPVLYGHFISVWRQADGGRWQVVVDLGTTHPAAEPGVASGAFTAGPRPAEATRQDRKRSAETEIRAAEKLLSAEAQKGGLASALAALAAEDLRFNRDGHLPALGLPAARDLLGGDSLRSRWTPRVVEASRSGDLGYAFGTRERLGESGAVSDTTVFLDVWRRGTDGQWRLVMGVDNPVAPRRSRQ